MSDQHQEMARELGKYGTTGNGVLSECSESSDIIYEASELKIPIECRPLLQRKIEEKKDGEQDGIDLSNVNIQCNVIVILDFLCVSTGRT